MTELEKLRIENGRLKNLLRETFNLTFIDEMIRDYKKSGEDDGYLAHIIDLKKTINDVLKVNIINKLKSLVTEKGAY
tara:strand:- start:358 stop:588 length:231 start_codon:yes stop_codon:yes gene_type:complete